MMVPILVSVVVTGAVSRVAAQATPGIPQQLQSLGVQVTAILKADQGNLQQLQNLDAKVTAILEALKSQGDGEGVCRARRYYLTRDTFDGANALTACADSFHMASLFEIFDPSGLVYDTALGFTSPDSGSGPPVHVDVDPLTSRLVHGWIRNGGGSFGGNGPTGFSNCNAWTSNSSSDTGSRVGLESHWGDLDLTVPVSPWRPSANSCDRSEQVWCVQ